MFDLFAIFSTDRLIHAAVLAINLLGFVLLITAYWVIINRLDKFIRSRSKSYKYLSWERLLLILAGIFLTIFTVILAFIDNLPTFFGSLSVLSAALVFALQDYVSCFFAWVYNSITKQYRSDDLILVNTDTRQIYGLISEVGIFRTQLRERLGGDSNDFERPTGRIITFPNNFIFRFPLTNLTKNHRILWHSTHFTITFESDFEVANSVINRTCIEVFDQLVAKADKYLELGIGDLQNFKPKVYYSIEASGVSFTVWFGCKIGMLRETLEKYSAGIMLGLKLGNINLAYTTIRVTEK